MDSKECSFVILISGRGSNMRSIVTRMAKSSGPRRGKVCAVISNNPDANGLKWANDQGIETCVVNHHDYPNRDLFDKRLAETIEKYQPDYILLAGFMRILTAEFVRKFQGKIINIHPSLLPSFPGLHTHQKAIDSGVLWHGCTVHLVTADLDAGPIIAQAAVPVLPEDDANTLSERVLSVEHQLYSEVVEGLIQGLISISGVNKIQVAQGVKTTFYKESNNVVHV